MSTADKQDENKETNSDFKVPSIADIVDSAKGFAKDFNNNIGMISNKIDTAVKVVQNIEEQEHTLVATVVKTPERVYELSEELNSDYKYMASICRTHTPLLTVASGLALGLPGGFVGKRLFLFGAITGASLALSTSFLFNYKYNHPKKSN